MDKVEVTDDGLQACLDAMSRFSETLLAATEKCANSLTQEQSGMDKALSDVVSRYAQTIRKMNSDMQQCLSYNVNALEDRLEQIPNYEKCVYVKRDIRY